MTEDEFISKIIFEGGVYDALEYGLRADDLDDQGSELAEAWRDLETAWSDFSEKLYAVEDLIDEDN